MEKDILIVRAVAPEDIAPGTYVVELRRVHEFINRCSLFGTMPEDGPLTRTVVTMPPRGPEILRVEAVAVPLVLVTRVSGKSQMLDIRRSRLGQVPAPFGKAGKPKELAQTLMGFGGFGASGSNPMSTSPQSARSRSSSRDSSSGSM